MTPDERDLRAALEARSGEASPAFRHRLTGAFQEGRPQATVMPAIALMTVIVLSLTSVGVLLIARGAGHVSYGGSVRGTRYTVTTTLMTDRRGRVVACHFYPLPMPPMLCGGVTITNVDPASIAATKTYSNGVVETPRVRMVGTWDGHALRLTEQPESTNAAESVPQPVAQTPPSSSTKSAQQILQELTQDDSSLRQQGIVLLEWGLGSDLLPYVVLAVADPTSVRYLYDTYGRVNISGWLQPVNPLSETPSSYPPPTVTIPMPTEAHLSVSSGHVVWAFIGGLLFRSADRGDTWEQRPLPPYQGGGFPEYSFVDALNGWFSSGGVPETQCNGAAEQVWHTADGGATWQQVAAVRYDQAGSSGISYGQCKQGLSFADATHGFLAAWDPNRRPTIYRTSDGGRTWEGSTLPDPPGFVTQAGGISLRAGLVRVFGATLLVTATDSQATTYVFRSIDGGATWSPIARVDGLANIGFVTASRWLKVIVPGQSVETTDSGQTWHSYPSDYSQAAPISPEVVFSDALVGYATVRGTIQRTVDGGLQWVVIKTPGT